MTNRVDGTTVTPAERDAMCRRITALARLHLASIHDQLWRLEENGLPPSEDDHYAQRRQITDELAVLASLVGHLTVGRLYRAESNRIEDVSDAARDAGVTSRAELHRRALAALTDPAPRVS